MAHHLLRSIAVSPNQRIGLKFVLVCLGIAGFGEEGHVGSYSSFAKRFEGYTIVVNTSVGRTRGGDEMGMMREKQDSARDAIQKHGHVVKAMFDHYRNGKHGYSKSAQYLDLKSKESEETSVETTRQIDLSGLGEMFPVSRAVIELNVKKETSESLREKIASDFIISQFVGDGPIAKNLKTSQEKEAGLDLDVLKNFLFTAEDFGYVPLYKNVKQVRGVAQGIIVLHVDDDGYDVTGETEADKKKRREAFAKRQLSHVKLQAEALSAVFDGRGIQTETIAHLSLLDSSDFFIFAQRLLWWAKDDQRATIVTAIKKLLGKSSMNEYAKDESLKLVVDSMASLR